MDSTVRQLPPPGRQVPPPGIERKVLTRTRRLSDIVNKTCLSSEPFPLPLTLHLGGFWAFSCHEAPIRPPPYLQEISYALLRIPSHPPPVFFLGAPRRCTERPHPQLSLPMRFAVQIRLFPPQPMVPGFFIPLAYRPEDKGAHSILFPPPCGMVSPVASAAFFFFYLF